MPLKARAAVRADPPEAMGRGCAARPDGCRPAVTEGRKSCCRTAVTAIRMALSTLSTMSTLAGSGPKLPFLPLFRHGQADFAAPVNPPAPSGHTMAARVGQRLLAVSPQAAGRSAVAPRATMAYGLMGLQRRPTRASRTSVTLGLGWLVDAPV